MSSIIRSSIGKHSAYPIFSVVCLLVIITTVILVGCDSCRGQSTERIGIAVRLTKGHWKDAQIRFHPTQPKLLLTRFMPEKGKAVSDPGQQYSRQIIELNFKNEERPKSKSLDVLSEGSFPSYAGNRGVLALDGRGRLVLLEADGSLKEIRFDGFSSRPAKPVASPDGKMIAFMATPPVGPDEIKSAADLEKFRHKTYVAPIGNGKVSELPMHRNSRAMLTSIRWADKRSLWLSYQISDPRDRFTRIERISLPDLSQRLALFADFGWGMSPAPSELYFVTVEEKPNHVTFISRGMEKNESIDLGADLIQAVMSPDGRFSIVSRYCEDVDGINIYLVPTPDVFLEK